MNADSIVKFSISEGNTIDAIQINVDSNLVKKLVNTQRADVARVRDRYVTAMYSHALMLYTTMAGYCSQDSLEMNEETIAEIQDNLNDAIESTFQYYVSFIMTFEDFAS